MQTKYLIDGRAVLVSHIIGKEGFLVQDLYVDDDGEEAADENKYYVKELYDIPPRAKYIDEIQQLQNKADQLQKLVDDLSKHKRELGREVVDAEREAVERLSKLQQFRGLSRLEDFLAGKITHLVEHGYSARIYEFYSGPAKNDRDRDEIKLLTLFGRSNGDLLWKINRWSDGSGGNTTVIPCCSYEEAVAALSDYLNSGEAYLNENVIKEAARHNIIIAEERMAAYRKGLAEGLLKQKSKHEKDLELVEQKLKELGPVELQPQPAGQ